MHAGAFPRVWCRLGARLSGVRVAGCSCSSQQRDHLASAVQTREVSPVWELGYGVLDLVVERNWPICLIFRCPVPLMMHGRGSEESVGASFVCLAHSVLPFFVFLGHSQLTRRPGPTETSELYHKYFEQCLTFGVLHCVVETFSLPCDPSQQRRCAFDRCASGPRGPACGATCVEPTANGAGSHTSIYQRTVISKPEQASKRKHGLVL